MRRRKCGLSLRLEKRDNARARSKGEPSCPTAIVVPQELILQDLPGYRGVS
jgi:hypothetical protein